MIPIRDTPSGATFQVKVHPRAKKNAITGEVGEALKAGFDGTCRWKAAPIRLALISGGSFECTAFVGYDSRRGKQPK